MARDENMSIDKFSNEDEKTFNKIYEIFNQDLQKELQYNDFLQITYSQNFEPLLIFNSNKDTLDYCFLNIDHEFEGYYNDLKLSIDAFCYKLLIYSISDGKTIRVDTKSSPWTQENSDRFRKEADYINVEARKLHKALVAFVLNGKKRLREKNMQNTIIDNNTGSINIVNSAGNDNIVTMNSNNICLQKIQNLIQELEKSDLEDKQDLIAELKLCKDDSSKINKFLAKLLTRGSEIGSLMSSIIELLSFMGK